MPTKRPKYTIEDLYAHAASKGGKCLSNAYTNNKTKYEWECLCGYKWSSSWSSIHCNLSWCPECSCSVRGKNRRKYTIQDLQKWAEEKNGRCLSEEYLGLDKKHKWKCSCDYTWHTRAGLIKNGSWCPKCSGTLPLTINDMKNHAAKQGGKCLSKQYQNARTGLQWQCCNGHTWKACSDSVVRSGSWCPRCRVFLTEEKCRFVFEQFTGHPFPKNKNILGNGQEVDGYCNYLQVGFEYQGEQHYMPKFGQKAFELVKKLDQRKRNRITKLKQLKELKDVIFIPYWESGNLEQYIRKGLESIGITISQQKIDFRKFPLSRNKLKELRFIARNHGGKLLSTEYCGVHSPLLWECELKHKWKAAPMTAKKGHWCPTCANDKAGNDLRLSIMSIQKEVTCLHVTLLSTKYVNNFTPLEWKCNKNSCQHIWMSSYSNMQRKIRQGKTCGCPRCNKIPKYKRTIKDMMLCAKKQGGRCLSTEYLGNKKHLKWECKYKHTWPATPDSILRGHWCPTCALNKRRKDPRSSRSSRITTSIC